jgi:hypothetical protein
MDLEKAIVAYCKRALPYRVYDCLPRKEPMSKRIYIQKVEALVGYLKEMIKRAKQLEENTFSYYKKLENLPKKKELKKMSAKELESILKKLSKGQQIIDDILKDRDLRYFLRQHIDQAVIRIKALGNEMTPENIAENIYQQKVLMAYLHDSSFLIYNEYQTYIEAMNEKIETKRGEIEK